mmetsp:Transcript_11248/g.23971  ORF Transcript_11248/g.23971 Transcript_11248/m.23971 type:complete len:115 (+) Transcript_11248:43-387(+)
MQILNHSSLVIPTSYIVSYKIFTKQNVPSNESHHHHHHLWLTAQMHHRFMIMTRTAIANYIGHFPAAIRRQLRQEQLVRQFTYAIVDLARQEIVVQRHLLHVRELSEFLWHDAL